MRQNQVNINKITILYSWHEKLSRMRKYEEVSLKEEFSKVFFIEEGYFIPYKLVRHLFVALMNADDNL